MDASLAKLNLLRQELEVPLANCMVCWSRQTYEAFAQLDGVGEAGLGEWREGNPRVFHLQRRLSAVEFQQIGPVRDIRGTTEATDRLAAVRSWLPVGWRE